MGTLLSMGDIVLEDIITHRRPPLPRQPHYPWETSSLETWLAMGELFQGDLVIHGRPLCPRVMVLPFPPESSWDIQGHSQQAGWDVQDEKRGWKEPGFGTAMQGCLSINGEQMGPAAFVSTYPTHQLSCSTKAGVTQLRWPGLVRGRSEAAQLPAWLRGWVF